MDSIFKQRLVGTLMLVALGAVFWPIIFVDPSVDEPLVLEPAPPKPVIDTSPLPAPQSSKDAIQAALNAPSVDPAQQAQADNDTRLAEAVTETAVDALPPETALVPNEVRREAPPGPQRDEAGYATSWVLQVATVSSQQRAIALVDKLTAKGYDAFARSLDRNDKTLWRVQIGPRLERAKLASIKTEIDSALKVNSTVLRYVQ